MAKKVKKKKARQLRPATPPQRKHHRAPSNPLAPHLHWNFKTHHHAARRHQHHSHAKKQRQALENSALESIAHAPPPPAYSSHRGKAALNDAFNSFYGIHHNHGNNKHQKSAGNHHARARHGGHAKRIPHVHISDGPGGMNVHHAVKRTHKKMTAAERADMLLNKSSAGHMEDPDDEDEDEDDASSMFSRLPGSRRKEREARKKAHKKASKPRRQARKVEHHYSDDDEMSSMQRDGGAPQADRQAVEGQGGAQQASGVEA